MQAQLEDAEQHREELEGQLAESDAAQRQLAAARRDLKSQTAECNAAQQQLAAARQELHTVQQDHAAVRAELERVQLEHAVARSRSAGHCLGVLSRQTLQASAARVTVVLMIVLLG